MGVMGVKERRERERLETRERILDAARELFIAEGYDRVSMRKIADKIEYSPTAIYVHFADKDELFREICHEDFRRLAHALIGLAQVADPVERIRKIGLACIDFGRKHPQHYRTMFMTPHPPILEEGAALAGKGNPEEDAYEFLWTTVAEAMKAGAFREGLSDPDLVAQTLWAGAHGVISLHIAKCNDDWVTWRSLKKRTETMLDALLQGLLKEK
jgi:AcrR family transcriptional regulator